MPSTPDLLGTLVASAIGTTLAAAVGLRYGLAKVRKERAFERRLQWYESAVKELTAVAERLSTIATDVRTLNEHSQRRDAFVGLNPTLTRLYAIRTEARMYSSASAYEAVAEATQDFDALIRASTILPRQQMPGESDAQARLLEICTKLVRQAANRLADEVREHLELEELLPSETGIYDKDYMEHLAALSARGEWPPPQAKELDGKTHETVPAETSTPNAS